VEQGHAENVIGVAGFKVKLVNIEGLGTLTGASEVTVPLYIGIAAGQELGVLLPE
jgi:glutamate synthase domain-containing protein 2